MKTNQQKIRNESLRRLNSTKLLAVRHVFIFKIVCFQVYKSSLQKIWELYVKRKTTKPTSIFPLIKILIPFAFGSDNLHNDSFFQPILSGYYVRSTLLGRRYQVLSKKKKIMSVRDKDNKLGWGISLL